MPFSCFTYATFLGGQACPKDILLYMLQDAPCLNNPCINMLIEP